MHRIHIVGISPRTGTTLLSECMVTCFDIDHFDAHETHVAWLRFGSSVYLTKRPGDLLWVETRLGLDPEFHVICLMRDPRDVIVSRHGKDPNRYWVPLRLWKQWLPVLRHLASHERFLIVRYEDLVSRPDDVGRWIAAHLPFLHLTREFSEFHLAAAPSADAIAALGRLRAFDTSSIGQWRRHLPRVAGQLQRHGSITSELIEFGTEQDATWLSALDGVEPDLSASSIPDERRPSALGRRRIAHHALSWLSARAVLAARALGVKIG